MTTMYCFIQMVQIRKALQITVFRIAYKNVLYLITLHSVTYSRKKHCFFCHWNVIKKICGFKSEVKKAHLMCNFKKKKLPTVFTCEVCFSVVCSNGDLCYTDLGPAGLQDSPAQGPPSSFSPPSWSCCCAASGSRARWAAPTCWAVSWRRTAPELWQRDTFFY